MRKSLRVAEFGLENHAVGVAPTQRGLAIGVLGRFIQIVPRKFEAASARFGVPATNRERATAVERPTEVL